MASKPGFLTEWPWSPLGNFKYVVLAPWVIESVYSYATKGEEERDLGKLLVMVLTLWRMVHSQIWISVSRQRTAKGVKRIVDRPIEFEQVDRERSWDDQIIFNAFLIYVAVRYLPGSSLLPVWRTEGLFLITLLHTGPVEFLYYWFHRALHHHFLYSRYHSHHHSSIATEPITSVVHPFAEHIAYSLLFAIPLVTVSLLGMLSISGVFGYLTYIDFMNNMGHCNFEIIPTSVFSLFPPLKFLVYTPSFHSLHHTQFRTNYSLFMPMYDYIYGTRDKRSDSLHEMSLGREEERADVVHLTHLTTPNSIYQLRLGLPSLASHPLSPKWYLCLLWPLTFFSCLLTRLSTRSFVFERNQLSHLTLHNILLPRFTFQYKSRPHHGSINKMIEAAILEADIKGTKVFSLGLLNQGKELNEYGEAYVRRDPQLRIRVVDGSGLAAAVVLNSIPKGTIQVVLRGKLTKVAYIVTSALCQQGVKVVALRPEEHSKLADYVGPEWRTNVVLGIRITKTSTWLVGDGLNSEDEMRAEKGTHFVPFSQFPPRNNSKFRKDCYYHNTPAMLTPKSIENIDSCENWLGRRVMSAWRVGGIVHALEDWKEHECGRSFTDLQKVWKAALRHGFRPINPACYHFH